MAERFGPHSKSFAFAAQPTGGKPIDLELPMHAPSGEAEGVGIPSHNPAAMKNSTSFPPTPSVLDSPVAESAKYTHAVACQREFTGQPAVPNCNEGNPGRHFTLGKPDFGLPPPPRSDGFILVGPQEVGCEGFLVQRRGPAHLNSTRSQPSSQPNSAIEHADSGLMIPSQGLHTSRTLFAPIAVDDEHPVGVDSILGFRLQPKIRSRSAELPSTLDLDRLWTSP